MLVRGGAAMEAVFDIEKLRGMLWDFHRITGLRVGVYNTDLCELAAAPPECCDFCALVRSGAEGLARCKACDGEAFARAKKTKSVHIYRCHAGLTEAASAIMAGGRFVGILMIGQLRDSPVIDAALPRVWDSLPAGRAELARAYSAMPVTDVEKIRASAHILHACAMSIWLGEYVKLREEDLSIRLDKYITANLTSDLSIGRICKDLEAGKTALCLCASRHLGMPVGALIRTRRLELAKRFLSETLEPISVIAGKTGFTDYNYFSRLFKRHAGLTPSAYRNATRMGERDAGAVKTECMTSGESSGCF
jgi:ligand-binding sensor protein